ncbi:hypothetical protein MNB_SV-15-1224 [hydrothermal vent metagenome]|uniref:Uncharacterized protein n=1 Tax=hydrothermal vent metagenome TaxID=652676 RepID=A0A1W1ELC5_9ZZZZ
MYRRDTISLSTKRVVFVIFSIFLVLFSKYTPYGNIQTNDNSTTHMIFNLYFFISNQTLGIVHEGGHGICYLLDCPKFFTALNGTIFQLLFPFGVGYYYRQQLNYIGWYIGIFFTGFSLHYTSWYISTAHQGLHIPASKSFLGQDGYHDFNYILNTIGLLNYDNGISILVKLIAYGLMIFAVWKMFILAFNSKS